MPLPMMCSVRLWVYSCSEDGVVLARTVAPGVRERTEGQAYAAAPAVGGVRKSERDRDVVVGTAMSWMEWPESTRAESTSRPGPPSALLHSAARFSVPCTLGGALTNAFVKIVLS